MAAIKPKKMTLPKVRKELRNLTKEKLIEMLEGIYKSCPDAANYMNVCLGGEHFEKAFLIEACEKVHQCFFTRGGNARLNLQEAKTVVEDFEKASPSPRSVLDLKLHYIEEGMEIIERYNGIPDKLYKSVEKMFQSVVNDINSVDDFETGKSLAAEFEGRLAEIGKEKGWGDAGFHESMNARYREIRWVHVPTEMETGSAGNEEKEELPVLPDAGTAQFGQELAPITDSANVLPAEDVELFYRIFFQLLEYVNENMHINGLHDIAAQESLDPGAVKEIADAVWNDTTLITGYLAEKGENLLPEHQAILKGWERCVRGRFVLERNLKKGAILISLEDNSVYQVRGIKSSLEEMFLYRPLPVMLNAVLIPFRGIIITDGLIGAMDFFLGGGMKNELKEIYTKAKRRNCIITSL